MTYKMRCDVEISLVYKITKYFVIQNFPQHSNWLVIKYLAAFSALSILLHFLQQFSNFLFMDMNHDAAVFLINNYLILTAIVLQRCIFLCVYVFHFHHMLLEGKMRLLKFVFCFHTSLSCAKTFLLVHLIDLLVCT